MVIAGGCGFNNEVKLFNYKSGELVAQMSNVERSVLCCDYANTSESFAVGTVDSKIYGLSFV